MKTLISIALLSIGSLSAFAATDADIIKAFESGLIFAEYECTQTDNTEATYELNSGQFKGSLNGDKLEVITDRENQPAITINSHYAVYIHTYKINTFNDHNDISSFTYSIKRDLGEIEVNIGSWLDPEFETQPNTSMHSEFECQLSSRDDSSIEP
jgi:hypothetical protein